MIWQTPNPLFDEFSTPCLDRLKAMRRAVSRYETFWAGTIKSAGPDIRKELKPFLRECQSYLKALNVVIDFHSVQIGRIKMPPAEQHATITQINFACDPDNTGDDAWAGVLDAWSPPLADVEGKVK